MSGSKLSLADVFRELLGFVASHPNKLGSSGLTEMEFGQLVELDVRVGMLARQESLPLPSMPVISPPDAQFLSHTHLRYHITNFGRKLSPSFAWLKEMETLRQLADKTPGETAASADPAADTMPHADGPEAPSWLWLGGERFRIGRQRSRRSWELLEYFWNRESETFGNLQGPTGIWHDRVADSAIETAVNRFNNEMPATLRWKLRTHHRRVVKESREIPAK